MITQRSGKRTVRGLTLLIVASTIAATAGCTSIKGYKVVTDANGNVKKEDVGGLPIVIQRPTRAVFIVTESVYQVEEVTADPTTGSVTKRRLADQVETTISPQPILLGPSEVYAFDQKRPAAGSIDYNIELQNFYPTKINAKVQDDTLSEFNKLIADLAEKIMAGLGKPPAIGGESKESGGIVERQLTQTRIKLAVFNLEDGTLTIQNL